MFKFLKDKLKKAIGSFSAKIAKEAKPIEEEQGNEEEQERKNKKTEKKTAKAAPAPKVNEKKSILPSKKEKPEIVEEKKEDNGEIGNVREESKEDWKESKEDWEESKEEEIKVKEEATTEEGKKEREDATENSEDGKGVKEERKRIREEIKESTEEAKELSEELSVGSETQKIERKNSDKSDEKEEERETAPEERETAPDTEEQRPKAKEKAKEKIKKGFLRLFGKKDTQEKNKGKNQGKKDLEKAKEKIQEEEKEETAQETEARKDKQEKYSLQSMFGRLTDVVTKTSISENKFEELFEELEIALLESNVAFEVVEKIKEDLKKELVEQRVLRGRVEEIIAKTLRNSINSLFLDPIDVLEKIKAKEEKPFVIAFVGVNGSGKTTTIAKFANLLQQNKLRPVLAAADTFRAAAIQQLEEHAKRLGIKIIKQDYGADPAAVGYDAVNYGKAHNMDAVLIDTAGRQHANTNLMEEMKKIVRVCKPDMVLFIGESITGNDCVDQAREFGAAVKLDGIILTKADVDEKGGAFVSVSHVTGKPILYVGMGQGYGDLKPFDKQVVMESLGV